MDGYEEILALVEGAAAGLHGQPMSPMLCREMARRAVVMRTGEGDPGAAVPAGRRRHRLAAFAQAVSIAVGDWSYGQALNALEHGGRRDGGHAFTGYPRGEDWEATLAATGPEAVVRRVAWLLAGEAGLPGQEVSVGPRGFAPTTLLIRPAG